MDEEEAQSTERPRPRVVDKRISARAERGEPAPAAPAAHGPEPMSPPAPPEAPASEAPPPREAPDPREAGAAPPEAASGPGQVWTPEQEAAARRLAQEIAATPAVEWVVNSAVTLANVAGTKLDAGQIAEAGLAIDALAGLLKPLTGRLGGADTPLRQMLAELQLAFAEATQPPPP